MGRILTPFAPSEHIGHIPDLPSACGGLRSPISGEKCDLIVTFDGPCQSSMVMTHESIVPDSP
jgi:hypothetical protein